MPSLHGHEQRMIFFFPQFGFFALRPFFPLILSQWPKCVHNFCFSSQERADATRPASRVSSARSGVEVGGVEDASSGCALSLETTQPPVKLLDASVVIARESGSGERAP